MTSHHDVIIVGAGHNALVTAAYLAKAGLKVAVIERNAWNGGGVVTREVTAPGFHHDMHSTTHGLIQANPLIAQDELGLKERFGLDYVRQKTVYGTIFPDGSSIVTHDELDRTLAELARFSERDARAYRAFMERAARVAPLLISGLFNPPIPFGAFMALLEQSPEGRDLRRDILRSAFDIVSETFEDDRLRMHLLRWASEMMIGPEEQGTGLVLFLMFAISHLYWPSIPRGGSGGLTAALVRCIQAHGGTVINGLEAASVIVEANAARGVILTSGERLRAARGVVASIHPRHLDRFVDGRLSPRVKGLAAAVRPSAYSSIVAHYALEAPPRFKGDSRIGEAYVVETMPATLEEFRRSFDEHRYGQLAQYPKITAVIQSNWDPTRAPAGQATLWLCQHVPYHLAEGGPQRWDAIKHDVAGAMLREFRRIADGAEDYAILGSHVESPLDYERGNASFHHGDIVGIGGYLHQFGGNRPVPELASYTVPEVADLFLAGPFMHPGGGVIGGGRATAVKIFQQWNLCWESMLKN